KPAPAAPCGDVGQDVPLFYPVPVQVIAKDADGNVITGTVDYDTPISLSLGGYSSPITLSTNLVTSPNTVVSFQYTGGAQGPVTITPTAAGVTAQHVVAANFFPSPVDRILDPAKKLHYTGAITVTTSAVSIGGGAGGGGGGGGGGAGGVARTTVPNAKRPAGQHRLTGGIRAGAAVSDATRAYSLDYFEQVTPASTLAIAPHSINATLAPNTCALSNTAIGNAYALPPPEWGIFPTQFEGTDPGFGDPLFYLASSHMMMLYFSVVPNIPGENLVESAQLILQSAAQAHRDHSVYILSVPKSPLIMDQFPRALDLTRALPPEASVETNFAAAEFLDPSYSIATINATTASVYLPSHFFIDGVREDWSWSLPDRTVSANVSNNGLKTLPADCPSGVAPATSPVLDLQYTEKHSLSTRILASETDPNGDDNPDDHDTFYGYTESYIPADTSSHTDDLYILPGSGVVCRITTSLFSTTFLAAEAFGGYPIGVTTTSYKSAVSLVGITAK
ncbi:MAG: hypothetical protein ACREM6_15770, partial [Vulcanimicrobiaceae bacterium]